MHQGGPHPLRGRGAAAALVCAALLAACTSGDDAPADAGTEHACAAVTHRLPTATPAPEEDLRFATRGPGWLAGDSAYSVALPDGDTAWLFSDSFIGRLDRWGRPDRSTTMVHNALLVEPAADDAPFETVIGRRGGEPHALFPDPPAGGEGGERDYYWVQDAVVEGEQLLVFLARTRQVGEDGFGWVGSAIARVALPDLTVTSIEATPSDTGIAWGAAVLEGADATYIYGVEDGAEGKTLHLARAPRGSVLARDTWHYWDGTAWTQDPRAPAQLTGEVANELSISPFADGYLMVSHDTGGIYAPTITARTACSPEGPWSEPTDIYTTPETGRGRHFTYNSHAHPELSADGELLISYNVNTFDFAELQRNPSLYRPRFVTLDLPG